MVLTGEALFGAEGSVDRHLGFDLVSLRQGLEPFFDENSTRSTRSEPPATVLQRHLRAQSRLENRLVWTRLDKSVVDVKADGFHLKGSPGFVIHDAMRFIAFDLETTGIVPGVDQIVEIGAVRFIDGQPESLFVTLVDPRRPIPNAATVVNGITDDMVAGKPLIEDLLPAFAEFCGEDPLVAHNASFDAQFLTSDIKKHEAAAPRGVILDTLPIARKVFPGLPNYKLATLVQHLKIQASEYHRAQADSISCGHLFSEMLRRISVAGRSPQLAQLVNLTGKPEVRLPQIVRQPKQLDLLGSF